MGKGRSTTTVAELAVLASNVGLVEDSDDGRHAFLAWYATDQKAARKALFAKTAQRRVAASARKAAAAGKGGTSAAAQYPAGWLRAAGVRRSKVRG